MHTQVYADAFFEKVLYFFIRLSAFASEKGEYKPVITASLAHRLDDLRKSKGIYLSDNDVLYLGAKPYEKNVSFYDEPYRNVTNHIYQFTTPMFGRFTIANVAEDKSWQFHNKTNPFFE